MVAIYVGAVSSLLASPELALISINQIDVGFGPDNNNVDTMHLVEEVQQLSIYLIIKGFSRVYAFETMFYDFCVVDCRGWIVLPAAPSFVLEAYPIEPLVDPVLLYQVCLFIDFSVLQLVHDIQFLLSTLRDRHPRQVLVAL